MINFKEELNDEQYAVVSRGDGPALVLAGAGSGKTRTITYRVAHLIENGVQEDRILLVTFTNKASREMLLRVEELLGRQVQGLWGGTFHSIALRLLKKYAGVLGYENNFTIIDSDDSKALIKLCIKEEGIDTSGKRFPAPRVLAGIISYARNADTTIGDVLDLKHQNFLQHLEQINAVANRYYDKKREAHVMDFDDLLINLYRLLTTNEKIREKLADQFQYVLVDEYQDTNLVQARIIKALVQKHRNILVVGDDAQSIYSFRAANIKNILQFEKDFPDVKIHRLEINYRSTPDILKVANTVISNNKKQFRKNLKSVVEPHVKPRIVPSANKFDEAKFIASRIFELQDAGVKANNIAILFRAAFHSQMLELELTKRGIPYEFRGGLRFFDRAHIKDVLAYLRLLSNLNDQVAWMRALSMQEGIGPATVSKILAVVKECKTLEEVEKLKDMPLSSKAKNGWWQMMQIITEMLRVPRSDVAELIRSVSTSRQYKDYLQATHTDWKDRLEDLQQLALFASKAKDLDSFLNEASLQEGFGTTKEIDHEPKVILSTIHQAKGLEWDTVFVIHMLMPGFPNDRALKEPDGLEEERRLFYVAITRAKRKLYFTYPMTSGAHTSVAEQPSQFLEEIDAHLIEQDDGYAFRTAPTTVYKRDNDDDITYIDDNQDDWRTKSFLKSLDDL